MLSADELMALASLAGQTIVTAAVTDVWETARRKIVWLFGRGDSERTRLAERRLDQTRQQLTAAEGLDVEQAIAAQQERWTARLADLLDEFPEAAVELRTAVEEIQAQLPSGAVSAADHSVAAGRDVNIKDIKADRGGLAAGIVSGNVTLPDPTRGRSTAS
jgi:hypothetical protein